MENATALQLIGHNESAIAPRPSLDRENLNFFAQMIEAAQLVPVDRNVPPAVAKMRVMAKICAGTAYGFDPVNAQENLHVINGKLTLSARGYAVLLNRSGKYATRVEYLETDGCRLVVLKKNESGELVKIGTVSYMKEDAERSGVLGTNPTWKKYPKDMYYASCIRRVVRRFAPEVLDGAAVDYDLAKRAESAPEPTPIAEPQQLAPAPVEEAYAEEVYDAPVDTDDGFEPVAEEIAPPVDPDEARKAELVEAVESKLDAICGDDLKAREKVLKGRNPKAMPVGKVEDLYRELCADEQ